METLNWMDKSAWADGEWQQEPDRIEWVFLGFPCLILRHEGSWLCGYVGIPPTHPYYGKDMLDIEIKALQVHKKITFSEASHHGDDPRAVCHQLLPKTDDYWWLGFDCSHSEDVFPRIINFYNFPSKASYKNVEFVKTQVEFLARQLNQLQ
ncbi:hypothetical protein [Trichormus variabilis]|uniref:Uncharacterized protein n=1 Tax=Trichormus variabilis SAG 1403-4b TaxID=447716 RepID=A0A3S1CI92_ANAVA|nr:hypothetical protein [Trichormus variabilis]MBD2629642.1 hypothetical protein [Trichormus variabilis FACHB-164]RUS92941.1 hypothetical protein DSM107003_46880 [Trichormus variabilis SAG 1403-4b]